MRSKAYWAARAAALEEELQNGADKLSEETIAEYERAIEAINADIRDTFSAYVAMDIPEGEAVKLLNAAESDKTYAELMQLFEETTDTERRAEILARVNAQAYGARISRLEGVKSRILAEMTRVANTAVAAHKLFYTRTLQKSYYTNVYNIAKGLNCGIDFSLLPTRAIDAALREPWNGANYSDRIWNHNDRFTEAVQNTVTTGIMAGHSVNRMAAQLEEYVKSEGADGVLYSTTRLVRTETAHFMNTGQKAAYDEIGIKKYRFVAALSERTCETCGGLDGKVFDVADAREGVNYPPMHPNCRCTTVMADAISKTRIARDPATGKNYKVDGNMTFEEWQASLTPEQKAAMETHVKEARTKKTKAVDNSGGSGIIKTEGHVIVEGKNVVGEWTQREGFDSAIDDIVDYQGFNGNPRIVNSKEEFETLVDSDHFIGERTFSSDNPDMVKLWDNQLKCLNGESYFYINCGIGGAQYGQGMYCAADYTKGTVAKGGFDHEIEQYSWGKPYVKTNWLTMDKSAKIIQVPHQSKAAEYISDEYRNAYIRKFATNEQKEFVDKYIEAAQAVENLTFSEPDSVIDEIYDRRNKASESIRDLLKSAMDSGAGKDPGVLAAEMGYDAINAAGHGETGSYTVVLNRTKLIIYGGDDYVYKPK